MKCKVCGKEFEYTKENHYVARDNDVVRKGFTATLVGGTDDEVKLYDAFDCPFCGCQNVVQERKRTMIEEEPEGAGLTPKDSIEDSTNEDKELPKIGTVNTECCMNSFDCVQCIGCDNYGDCKKIDEAGMEGRF